MYKDEFPDYDAELWIPKGFEDGSWHNDVCPRATKILDDDEDSFIEVNIWQDYKNPNRRENPDACRYILDIEVNFSEVFRYATNNLEIIKKIVDQNLTQWDWHSSSNRTERS